MQIELCNTNGKKKKIKKPQKQTKTYNTTDKKYHTYRRTCNITNKNCDTNRYLICNTMETALYDMKKYRNTFRKKSHRDVNEEPNNS